MSHEAKPVPMIQAMARATEQTMIHWQKAQEAGWVDEHYQPKLSRTQSAMLAEYMAEQLGIKKNKWKVFGILWNKNNIRSDYNLALSQKQSYNFMDDLKRVLNE